MLTDAIAQSDGISKKLLNNGKTNYEKIFNHY